MDPNEWTAEQASDRAKLIQDEMVKHVGMAAFVLPEPTGPEGVFKNGTVSFLQTPREKLLVTNHHVWDSYLQERGEFPGLRLMVMGEGFSKPVDISSAELVSKDKDYDIAVLRFDANQLESVGKRFYIPKQWPMVNAAEQEHVVFVGFPGNRKTSKEQYLHFESAMLGMRVLSVSDRKVMLKFENLSPELFQYSSSPIVNYIWGGMSGCMVYHLNSHTEKFDVVGFLHAAGEGLQATFYMSKASVIQEDGTIQRM